jgi:hypothetical protein
MQAEAYLWVTVLRRPCISLVWLRETINLHSDIWSPGWDLNWISPEYKLDSLLLSQTDEHIDTYRCVGRQMVRFSVECQDSWRCGSTPISTPHTCWMAAIVLTCWVIAFNLGGLNAYWLTTTIKQRDFFPWNHRRFTCIQETEMCLVIRTFMWLCCRLYSDLKL